MLGSSDRQLVCGVVVDDLGDGGEGRAVLSEHVTPVCRLSELHVHEAFAAPYRKREKEEGKIEATRACRDIYITRLEVNVSEQTFTTSHKCPGVLSVPSGINMSHTYNVNRCEEIMKAGTSCSLY